MNIALPELSLVLLVGPSGSGKSSFGRKHFLPTEVVHPTSAEDSFQITRMINQRRATRSTSCKRSCANAWHVESSRS